MQETPQEYTQRILSYQQGQAPLKVLASSPGKLARVLKGRSRRALTTRPDAGQWSAAEILAHMADTEIVFSFRLRLTLGLNGTLTQAFDQNVWAEYSAYAKQDPALSLEAYRVVRERNVRLLRTLPRELWANFGMHEERGRETVTRQTEMMAGHDINHIRQIEQILRPSGRRTGRKKEGGRK